MKLESPQFTEEQVQAFVTDYFELEKANLAERLKKIADEVEAIAGSISHQADSSDEWNPRETLAHMVTSSQYFGWLAYQIAGKKKDAGDILEMLRMRDEVTGQAAELSVEVLTQQLRENLERTAAFIEKVSLNDLRVRFDYVGVDLTVEDLIRLPLCAHLESHVDQMRRSI